MKKACGLHPMTTKSCSDGTTDGVIQTYLGCEIERDMLNVTTTLSQKHYTEDILRIYDFWGSLPLCFICDIVALWEAWATLST